MNVAEGSNFRVVRALHHIAVFVAQHVIDQHKFPGYNLAHMGTVEPAGESVEAGPRHHP